MKAIEYVEKFEEYLVNPPEDLWMDKPEGVKLDETDAIIAICRDLFLEVKDIALSRNAISNLALLAIFREQDQKFLAFLRRLKTHSFQRTGFRAFVGLRMPDVAQALRW